MKSARNMLACCSIFMSFPLAAQVNVTVQPAQPSMERSRCCILLSFDFELKAPGIDTLNLESIQAVLLDSRGKQLGVHRADHNGAPYKLALRDGRSGPGDHGPQSLSPASMRRTPSPASSTRSSSRGRAEPSPPSPPSPRLRM